MNRKRRRLRPTAVLALILLALVIVLAVVVVVRFVRFRNPDNNDVPELPETSEGETVTPDTPDVSDTPVEPEVPEESELPPVVEEIPEIKDDAPKPVYSQEELISMYPDVVLSSTDDAGVEYIDDIYFIGDSTTHGMKYYGVLSGGKETDKVWTPRSGTLAMWNLLTEKVVMGDGNEETIPDAVDVTKPQMVVLTLGVNGVSSCSKEQFTGYYKDLIKAIKEKSPDTVIIMQSIYPVCSDYQYVNSISMEKINNANSWIAELANENGCYFLNTCSVLVDETGYLKPSYSNGDGIHISPEGFSVILDYIRTHAYLG